ncbi:cupredoxin domain-containing protein [Undibacterium arcticum]|uniref:Cupredoxin domain-containing protein n=2 Tax=Undibacterium arcticum TaxID=1762892 RepID=A0ABV7F997_9BURK
MMISRKRRSMLLATILLGMGSVAAYSAGNASPRVIRVQARRFSFTPNELHLQLGQPVVLELTTADVVMGFNIPDLKKRADIIPDTVARLELTPDRIGTFSLFCDIFCGDGHETMTGKVIVTA